MGCSSAATLGRRRDRGSKRQAPSRGPEKQRGLRAFLRETASVFLGGRCLRARGPSGSLVLAASAARDAARRQAGIRQRTGNKYLDNLYEEYGVCSELDGTAAHPADEQWRDKRRDNAHAVQGIVTLRFGLLDLGDRSCQTAADVTAVLRWRGWMGDAHPCSRQACALRDDTS